MSEKDFNNLMELAERQLAEAESATPEEALQAFVMAGILDESGKFTEPYRALADVVKPI